MKNVPQGGVSGYSHSDITMASSCLAIHPMCLVLVFHHGCEKIVFDDMGVPCKDLLPLTTNSRDKLEEGKCYA
jgi:hypothetical protein